MYTHIAANKRKSVLVLAFFVAFIIVLGWIADQYAGADGSFLWFAGILSVVMSIWGYYSGDAVALWSAGAKQIKSEDNPYVYRMVENLAISSGLPMPKVYVIDDPAMNAFATGRDPKHASIAVTTGIVAGLENEELEGVIAHELSHIGNYDIRFMTLVGVLVGMIALFADMFWRTRLFGGGRSSDDNRGGNGILAIVGIVLIILSPIVAQLIRLAVSRRREYLADASGALLTRYPEGLARALEKIASQNRPLARANNATAHLFIANPFGKVGQGLSHAFSTHPPIADRIRILREMGGLDTMPNQ